MSPQLVAFLVIAATVVAWLGFVVYIALGKKEPGEEVAEEREEVLVGAAVAGAPGYVVEVAEPAPRPRRVDEEVMGVSRRRFLNQAWVFSFLVGMGQFTLASLDFVWPRLRGGFGTKISVDMTPEQLTQQVEQNREPVFVSDGRFFLVPFVGDPGRASEVPAYGQANTLDTGVLALYRKCVHLGCSVPWCKSAQWFECPCHGSKYSVNGEYRDGPAPRSLDRFPVVIEDGKIVVDTASIIEGPPRGTVTSQPQPEGEHCVRLGE